LGGVPFNADTHTAVKSSGCGKKSPYKLGTTSSVQAVYGGVTWTYRIYVPKNYNKDLPTPLVLQHPGWGMDAKSEEKGAGITDFADSKGFISVTPQGMNDNNNYGGPWYSWNAVGSTQSPGPAGATCTSAANYPSYCYTSCKPCTDKPQCSWTTCDNTVTPTGTGTKHVTGFIPSLYDTLEEQLCIDTTREYAAGESNGGMMCYQLGVDLASRLAAIAPQFGSFHRGFAMAPTEGLPVIDLHGRSDTTVPGNVSLSADGYYYTPTSEIFDGGKYSTGWKKANGCTGSASHYATSYDNVKKLWCSLEGKCSGGDVVRCAYDGGHNWFNGGGKDNGGIVTDFLLAWTKPSHAGRGYKQGEPMGPGNLLQNITIYDPSLGGGDPSEAPAHQWEETVLKPAKGGHYGNPAHGCLDDEDVIPAGSGHVCAPKIGSTVSDSSPPTPKCKIGGVGAFDNGCPVDADVTDAKAWPICLAKGKSTDGYMSGEFHCLLVCPCQTGQTVGGECSAESHEHCPAGARCERGELRKRDQGVCTYPPSAFDSLVV
jgi:poly(3-hydroxybutyrate) depolymerase